MPICKTVRKNCGLITGFLFESENYPASQESRKECFEETKTCIEHAPFSTLIAITANYYQKSSHEVLKENGFKQIVTFNSAHDIKEETLTFWIKKNHKPTAETPDKREKTQKFYDNCSVSFGDYDRNKRLCIRHRKVNKEFKKVRNAPIWFKIAKRHLVKTKTKA
jgi:hypothetical protein